MLAVNILSYVNSWNFIYKKKPFKYVYIYLKVFKAMHKYLYYIVLFCSVLLCFLFVYGNNYFFVDLLHKFPRLQNKTCAGGGRGGATKYFRDLITWRKLFMERGRRRSARRSRQMPYKITLWQHVIVWLCSFIYIYRS